MQSVDGAEGGPGRLRRAFERTVNRWLLPHPLERATFHFIGNSRCVWKYPGDTRTEAWMQSTLAFRWRAAFEQKHSRICEWFLVPDLTEAEIVGVLDGIYGLVPADMVEQHVATLF